MVDKIFIALIVVLMIPTQTIRDTKTKEPTFKEPSYTRGFWIETHIEEIPMSRNSKTKSGTKTVTYYHEETILWTVQVRGTFIYGNGESSVLTSQVRGRSFSSAWKITSKSATHRNNVAIAKATGKRYLMGMVVQVVHREVSLRCSASGILS